MRGVTHWRWHLDEMYVKINGETHYLWRAVDHEGEILESFVTKARDKAAAVTFMKKALKRHGSPELITTDGLKSYRAAMTELGNAVSCSPISGTVRQPETKSHRTDSTYSGSISPATESSAILSNRQDRGALSIFRQRLFYQPSK